MVEMAHRVDCVCICLQRWASQQLAKAGRLSLWTTWHAITVLCHAQALQALQAGRQTGGSLGCWTIALSWTAVRELTLATLLGLKTTKSASPEQATRHPRTKTARGPRTKDKARRNNSV